jgi:hypothetical protein
MFLRGMGVLSRKESKRIMNLKMDLKLTDGM